MPKPLQHLLDNNGRWAADTTRSDPEFFRRLAGQQAPQYLWIGCADSRVPANEITGLMPGEIFVHRNVANLVVHSDLNCLSVLQYAVDVLHVEHVIVCGHYGCGGVGAAFRNERVGLVDNWLGPVRALTRIHAKALDALPLGKPREDRLCELNVVTQVRHVSETTIVQDAWARQQRVAVHGWIYRVSDGLLRDLDITMSGPDDAAVLERAVAPR
jgi:carbonic anhydrase